MLDTPQLMWAGWDQQTVASLNANGLDYICYVWLNNANYRVEALCKVRLPDGTTSIVFHNYVDVATTEEIQGTSGYPLDCPKIIAVGTTFVVHWLAADSISESLLARNWSLWRAIMDMEAFDENVDGWNTVGELGVYFPYALYDVAPLIGSDTDFLLARCIIDDSTIRVERYNGFGVIDTDWQTDLSVAIEGRVLAVYGHESDNDVLVTYEREVGEADSLWTWHLDADDGDAAGADVQSFIGFGFILPHGVLDNTPTLEDNGVFYAQAAHVRVSANVVALVAEGCHTEMAALGPPSSMIHCLAYRLLDSSTAAISGTEYWCPHLSMVSKPWAYNNGEIFAGGGPNVYIVVSRKSLYPTSDWEQAAIWCVDLMFPLWEAGTGGQDLRPRPVATLSSVGIPDARVSGWHPEGEHAALGVVGGPIRRVNHLSGVTSAPQYGPLVKTRTVAVGVWAQMGQHSTDPDATDTDSSANVGTEDGETIVVSGGELQPENLGIHGFTIHLEDPQTIYRNDGEPTQPVDNFIGANSRAACLSAEVGQGLAMFGGTPYLYDGERVGELGFAWGPEIISGESSVEPEGNTGELFASSTYRYYAIYSRRDAAGQVHRSPPSRVFSITLGGLDSFVSLRMTTLTLSLWDNHVVYPTSPETEIEVFRTTANGAVFYRLFGKRVADPGSGGNMRARDTPLNIPLAYWGVVDIDDGLSDAELVLQGAAPFTLGAGGFEEVTPQVVPALTCPAVWQGRLWGADALDPSLIWYSDQILPDFSSDYYRAPEFCDTNTFRIDGTGEVLAMQPMGNELIVFTRDGIFAIQGDGNDGLGEGANLVLTTIDASAGCIEPRSIVLAPPGIFYQSEKGYYLLSRGKDGDFATAGLAVDDDIRDAGNIRAATMMPDRHQIRIACNGRPLTTYTTTLEVVLVGGADGLGIWEITLLGLGAPGVIASVDYAGINTESVIADAIAAAVEASRADRSTGVHLYIAAVSSPGSNVFITWQPDVVPDYSTTSPLDTTFEGVDASGITTRPRVLIYDYLFRQWSRADLLSASLASQRMNEVVGGCAWRGHDGGVAHVVLQQGGLRIERGPRDPLAYSDQLSTGIERGIPISLRTTPFHPWGFAGYGRIWSIGVQTLKPNVSAYLVDLEYYTSGNYDLPDGVDEGVTVDTTSPPYMRVRPRIQRAAIALTIYEDIFQTALENVAIVGLVFEVGMHKGPRRVADAQIGRP